MDFETVRATVKKGLAKVRSAAPDAAATVRGRAYTSGDDTYLLLPRDVTHQRITWGLIAVFVGLLAFAMLLLILLFDVITPQGFNAKAPSPVATFVQSVYDGGDVLLSQPSGVAVSPAGEIYVADTGNQRIVVLNAQGRFVRAMSELGTEGEGAGAGEAADSKKKDKAVDPRAFVAPTSLAFSEDGRLFVVDTGLKALVLFDSAGDFVRGIYFIEEAPISVKVNRDTTRTERLYVTTKSGVAIGDLDGSFSIGYFNWGSGAGQLDNPAAAEFYAPQAAGAQESQASGESGSGDAGGAGADADADADAGARSLSPLVVVCDSLNYRVQAFESFDTSPTPVWVFGTPLPVDAALKYAGGDRKFGLPVDMALSPEGRLFVVDGLSSEIVAIDAASGAFLYTISNVGSDDGLLYYPAGIAYANGRIYVADKFNNRVTVFEDNPQAEPTPVVVASEGVNRWWLLAPLLLALVAVLVRLGWLRNPEYLADLSFLEDLAREEALQGFVRDNLQRLVVPLGTEGALSQVLPGFPMKVLAVDEARLDEVRDAAPKLDEEELRALLAAQSLKGKRYVLTGSRALEAAAEQDGLHVVLFSEFRALALAALAEEQARVEQDKKPVAAGEGTDAGEEAAPTEAADAAGAAVVEKKVAKTKPAARKKPVARKKPTGTAKTAAAKKTAEKKPAAKKPVAKKPAAKKPAGTKTVAEKKPATKKPAAAKKPAATAKKTTEKKPATAKKPAAKKAAEKKPAVKKPTTKKPATKQTAVKKPAAKKPAAKKPATKKTETQAKKKK
jgi:DNA-binding beta-propeller fold protein YncE